MCCFLEFEVAICDLKLLSSSWWQQIINHFPYIFLTLSSKYLFGLGAGASPILLPRLIRMYSGKVRTL